MALLRSSVGLALRSLAGSQYMISLQKQIFHLMEALIDFTALSVRDELCKKIDVIYLKSISSWEF